MAKHSIDRRTAAIMGQQALRQPFEIPRVTRIVEAYRPDGRGGGCLVRVPLSLPYLAWADRPMPETPPRA